MLAAGTIERVGRGLYRRTDAEPADYDLVEIAARAHKPTLCLTSALSWHQLTDAIPAVHDIAIPRGVWQPVVLAPVRWHQFDVATFDIGRDQVKVDRSFSLGLYDAPRSIIDCYRLRHELGPEVAHEALRRWLRRGGQPSVLLQMALDFPAARAALLNALQILL
jgi:predicted transcriptional regulator of viral defense system